MLQFCNCKHVDFSAKWIPWSRLVAVSWGRAHACHHRTGMPQGTFDLTMPHMTSGSQLQAHSDCHCSACHWPLAAARRGMGMARFPTFGDADDICMPVWLRDRGSIRRCSGVNSGRTEAGKGENITIFRSEFSLFSRKSKKVFLRDGTLLPSTAAGHWKS